MSSAYALQGTVADASSVDPLIRYTVSYSFHVDDCLSSTVSKSQAKVVITETPKTVSKGGFNLTKFVVNDKELPSEMSVESRAKEVRELGSQSESRALGIKWMVSSDEFFELQSGSIKMLHFQNCQYLL